MAVDRYDHLSKIDLIALLHKRDVTRKLGLVWERDEIEHERVLNDDFVTLELDENLSVGQSPYQNVLIEGDNFDALRYLHIAYKGRVKCIYIDPPYNTGNKDFIYNDRFIEKEDAYRHSKWLEFLYRRLILAKDFKLIVSRKKLEGFSYESKVLKLSDFYIDRRVNGLGVSFISSATSKEDVFFGWLEPPNFKLTVDSGETYTFTAHEKSKLSGNTDLSMYVSFDGAKGTPIELKINNLFLNHGLDGPLSIKMQLKP